MPGILKEFRDFLMKGNLISLAVAFVIGTAFYELVNALVSDLIMPILSMVVGKSAFDDVTLTINGSVFRFGSFLSAAITFIAIAGAVFFFIVKPVDVILSRSKKTDVEPEPPDEERRHQELLAAIRATAR